jgi:hypothetical protein
MRPPALTMMRGLKNFLPGVWQISVTDQAEGPVVYYADYTISFVMALLNTWQPEQADCERLSNMVDEITCQQDYGFKTARGTLAVTLWVNKELISLLGVTEPSIVIMLSKG